MISNFYCSLNPLCHQGNGVLKQLNPTRISFELNILETFSFSKHKDFSLKVEGF